MIEWLKKLISASGTSSAFTSLGVTGPLLALIVIGVNTWFGGTVLPDNEAVQIVDHVSAIVGLVLGVIGRIRAIKKIGGGPLS